MSKKEIKNNETEYKKIKRKENSVLNFINNLNDADKQRFVTFLAYIVILAVAVLSSYWSVAFGTKEEFKLSAFVTALCFNIVIGIICLMLSIKDGRLSNETRRRGDLFEMKQEFKRASAKIVDLDAFRQWNDANYEKERKEYIMDELAKINIFDYEYLNVSEEDLKKLLLNPCECVIKKDGKDVIVQLDQIDEYQKEMISHYKSGKFKFKKLPYSFFKSFKGRNDYKYYADTEGSDQKIELMAYVYRITMIVVFSIIISFTLVNPNDANSKQVIYDTVSRLCNAVLSIFMGYSLAHDEKNRLVDGLSFKIDKIDNYITDLDSGKFIPTNRSDAVAQKIKEIRDRKQAALIENKVEVNDSIEDKKEVESPIIDNDSEYIEMTQEEFEELKKNHPEIIAE